MTKLTAIIIDDEARAGDALRLALEKFVPEVTEIVVCLDSRQAAAAIAQHKPQLVFLDIKMPYLSGFDVLEQIPHQHFKVIFTTAFNEFAIKAIRFSAFDYLLKPIDVEDLAATVARFLTMQKDGVPNSALLNNMLYNMQATSQSFRLALPGKEGAHFIQPASILYCEAVSNYTRFYTDDGNQLVTSKTLGYYEDLLTPYGFIRCHKSFIVNRSFIAYIDYDGFIVLNNAMRLEVSKRRKAEVLRLMKTH